MPICRSLGLDLEYTLNSLRDEEQKKLQNSTILITGCAGFLGYYYLRFFQRYADELSIKRVIGLDNFMLGMPAWIEDIRADPRFDIRKFDIILDRIQDMKNMEDVDYVIHMASIASPAFYRQYPIETLDANIWGLRELLDFYVNKGLKGMLFYSSSEIYGDPDVAHIPTAEDYRGFVSCTGPRACYDESKRFGETMCMLFAQKYDLPIGVVRPFNNYGPGMKLNDKRLPADFAKSVYENRDLVILSNGAPTRTFCYIADSMAGYLKVLLHGKYDYFNIGMDQPEITVQQLADYYVEVGREIFGYTGKVAFAVSEDRDYLTDNPQRRCPDLTKARTLLGYRPTIEVQEGVRRFLRFIKESGKEDLVW